MGHLTADPLIRHQAGTLAKKQRNEKHKETMTKKLTADPLKQIPRGGLRCESLFPPRLGKALDTLRNEGVSEKEVIEFLNAVPAPAGGRESPGRLLCIF